MLSHRMFYELQVEAETRIGGNDGNFPSFKLNRKVELEKKITWSSAISVESDVFLGDCLADCCSHCRRYVAFFGQHIHTAQPQRDGFGTEDDRAPFWRIAST